MKLKLERKYKKDKYIIGNLYINDVFFCNVIEDKDRGLKQSTPLSEIKKIKVPSETAIPYGTYKVTINVVSPKFSQKDFYKKYANGGRVPRLLNVPGFEGILMHCGSTEKSSAGCLILGENKVKGKVINTEATFKKFYPKLQEANKKGESIMIEII